MTDQVSQIAKAVQVTQMTVATEASQVFRGQYKMETVVALPPSQESLFESAQEEMSFAVADQMGSGLSKKKFSKETRIRSHLLEKADDYIKRIPDINRKALDRFVSQSAKSPFETARQWKQFAKATFDDPAHQFAALVKAREALIKKGSSTSAVAALSDAIDELTAESGAEIDAALNISGVIDESNHALLGGVSDLRSFYRDSVLDYGNISLTYQKIMEKYGAAQFKDSLNFLLKGLGADISARSSSLEPSRLRAIMEDIYIIKLLGGVREQVSELIETLKIHYQATDIGNTEMLMKLMLDLKNNTLPKAKDFLKLTKNMNIVRDDLIIYCLQEVKRFLRLIPLKAYDNDTALKSKLIMAAQEAIDIAILKEAEAH